MTTEEAARWTRAEMDALNHLLPQFAKERLPVPQKVRVRQNFESFLDELFVAVEFEHRTYQLVIPLSVPGLHPSAPSALVRLATEVVGLVRADALRMIAPDLGEDGVTLAMELCYEQGLALCEAVAAARDTFAEV